MIGKTLYIPARELIIGSMIKGYQHEGCSSSFNARVKSVTDEKVEVLMWDKNPETFNLREHNYTFGVKAPEDWYKAFYNKEDILPKLKNRISSAELGSIPHTMYNGFISSDPYEMIHRLTEKDYSLVGICYDPPWTANYGFTAGVVIESTIDFEKEWCHFHPDYVRDMIEELEREV